MSNSEYENTDLNASKNEAPTGSDDYFSPGVRNHVDSTAGVVQSIGHLLSNARSARGMSVAEVAQQLRISTHQVEAIEREDFDKLPGPVFVRGFVRNYANLVGLESATLLQMLPQSTATVRVERTPFQMNDVALSSSGRGRGIPILPVVAVLAILALLFYGVDQGSSWWKKLTGDADSSSPVLGTDQSDQETIELQLPISSAPMMGGGNTTGMGVTSFTPTLQSNSPLPIENTYGTLHFLFTADAWVEVKDGSGKTIFEQTNSGGSERVISGQRPLSLVIKNAAGVSLTYNDRAIDINPYTRSEDGTANFTLE